VSQNGRSTAKTVDLATVYSRDMKMQEVNKAHGTYVQKYKIVR